MAEIRIEGLRKTYGGTTALDGVDLHIEDGEFFGLFGPSGAGKTSLLRCVAGLETPDEGRILMDGEDVSDLPPSERGAAMVFESYALYPHLTVWENIAYPLRERKMEPNVVKQRVEETAERLGVSHTLNRRPQTLSGGEMQRVAIGRAIAREARAYLLDEPLSHLDAQLREQMRAELKRLHRQMGASFLYATPDQLEAMTLPDRIAALDSGKVAQCGPPLELYDQPSHAFVARCLGDPPMNLIAGSVDGEGFFTAESVETPPLRVKAPPGPALLGARPEALTLSVEAEAHDPGRVSFTARVFAAEMRGDYALVALTAGEERIQAVAAERPSAYQYNEKRIVSFFKKNAYLINPATDSVVSLQAHIEGDVE